MSYLNYNLEKVASVVQAATKLVAPSASKMSLAQRLNSVAAAPKADASLASKLKSKAIGRLKSKIKSKAKSMDLSGSDASLLDYAELYADYNS